DRTARGPHDHRPRHHGRDVVAVVARHHHRGVLEPDRDQRPVLALRRYRLDLPVSAALPGGTTCPLSTPPPVARTTRCFSCCWSARFGRGGSRTSTSDR